MTKNDHSAEFTDFIVQKISDSKIDENGIALYKFQYVCYKWLNEENLDSLITEKEMLKHYIEGNKKRKRGRPPGSTKKVLADRRTNTTEDSEEQQNDNTEVSESTTVHTDNNLKRRHDNINDKVADNRVADVIDKQPWRSKRLRMKENIAKSDSSSLSCKYCNKFFRTEEMLFAHGLDHDEDMFPVKQRLSTDLFQVIVLDKKREYKCRLCSEKFKEKKEAKVHQKIHDDTNPWYCEHCSKHFFNEDDLNAHHLKIHSNDKLHNCPDCNQFVKLQSMRVHRMVYCSGGVDGKTLFTCDICSKTFVEALLLKQHLTDEHSIKDTFQCNQCFIYLSSVEQLNEHLLAHDQTYQCSVCLQTFTSLEDCTEHATTHEEMSFKCNRCPETFSLSEDLEMHYQMSEDCLEIACTECNVSFKTLEELSLHLQSVAQPSIHDNTTVILYICGYCQRGFHLESSYLQHSESHVSESNKPCPQCSQTFADGEELTKHLTTVHELGMLYPCVECNKPFDDDISMRRHARFAHGKENLCRCLPCGKSFYQRIDLNKHVITKAHKTVMFERIVNGKQNESIEVFHCSICERVFHNLNELKRHEYQHQKVDIKPGDEFKINNEPEPEESNTIITSSNNIVVNNDNVVINNPPELTPTIQSLASQAYIDPEFYKSINGKDVIFTDEHSQVNARITIDDAGNIGVIYLKDDATSDESVAPVDSQTAALTKFVDSIPNESSSITQHQDSNIADENLESVEKFNSVELSNDVSSESISNKLTEEQASSSAEISVTAVMQKLMSAYRKSNVLQNTPIVNQQNKTAVLSSQDLNNDHIADTNALSQASTVFALHVDHNTTPLNVLQESTVFQAMSVESTKESPTVSESPMIDSSLPKVVSISSAAENASGNNNHVSSTTDSNHLLSSPSTHTSVNDSSEILTIDLNIAESTSKGVVSNSSSSNMALIKDAADTDIITEGDLVIADESAPVNHG